MTFEWKGATITAREFTIADDDAMLRFAGKLPEGAIVNSATPFVEFQLGAVIEGGDSPVPRITLDSTLTEITAAYNAWQALPRRFLALWRQEVQNADAPDPKASASKT